MSETELMRYICPIKQKKSQLDKVKRDAVGTEISNLRNQLKDNKQALSLLAQLENAYKSENKYLNCRVERTESFNSSWYLCRNCQP